MRLGRHFGVGKRHRPEILSGPRNPNPEAFLEDENVTYGDAVRAFRKKLIAVEKNEGSFNGAPVIFEGLVIVGLGISEQGVKAWVGAYKLENGEPVWRFNTVPDEGEPGAETWGKPEAKLHGGGAV